MNPAMRAEYVAEEGAAAYPFLVRFASALHGHPLI